MNRIAIAVIMAGCLSIGCITPWEMTTGSLLDNGRYGLAMGTPTGWYMRQINRTVILTQHGLSLEYVMLDSREWDDTLSNGYALPAKLLLNEIPQIILGELCAYAYAFNLAIDSQAIVFIDSLPCSVTHYSYNALNSLQMKGVMYCIPFRKALTILRYNAEKTVYFEKTYADFVKLIPTIAIRTKKYLPLPGVKVAGE
jgi:hypothetical protein